MQKINTCLWFDHQAEEALQLYSQVFNVQKGRSSYYTEAMSEPSGQPAGSLMLVEARIEDHDVQLLNAGPLFKFSPSLSFFVTCKSPADVAEKWKKLSAGGQVRMGLDKYPWAESYGWTTDKFGVEWQLIYSGEGQPGIAPGFLFTDALFGKGEEAVKFYTDLIPQSQIDVMSRDEKTNTIMHCAFRLAGQKFVMMEGPGEHGHTFSHATSIVINCKDQKEIDTYYNALLAGGEAEPCGWVKDKYGVSWQIVPEKMGEWMESKSPEAIEKMMAAMVKMTKLDIAALEKAAQS